MTRVPGFFGATLSRTRWQAAKTKAADLELDLPAPMLGTHIYISTEALSREMVMLYEPLRVQQNLTGSG